MKKYISKFVDKILQAIKYPINTVKTYKERLVQTTELDLQKDAVKTVPEMLWGWLVDVVQYGLMLTFIYSNVFIWTGTMKWLLMPISIGMARWLFLDFIGDIRNKIR